MSSQLNLPSSLMHMNGGALPRVELPPIYGVTRQVLLPRDPDCMHSYWEVAPYTWDEVNSRYGARLIADARAILRLHLTRSSSKNFFDVAVEMAARNWTIRAPERGGSWVSELGLLLPDGRFVVLAVSNEIILPRGQVSETIDDRWGMLKAGWERIYRLSGGGHLAAGSSLDIAKSLGQRWEFLQSISSRANLQNAVREGKK